MDAKELRLTNWVTGRNDPPMKVVSINISGDIELRFAGVDADYGDWHYDVEDLQPILLTRAILEKSGFIKGDTLQPSGQIPYAHKDNGSFIIISCEDGTFWLDGYVYDVNVEFVHQLQNLYFALIGEELEINL
jgi:hypothetical protein